MLFKSYGLFWERNEIDWTPGSGRRNLHLYGRHCQNLPGLRVAGFRKQVGIYILYDDWGPYYVGLARTTGLGERLKDHVFDSHSGKWSRFSWFGFRSVARGKSGRNSQGVCELGVLPRKLIGSADSAIGDGEAMLIRLLHTNGNTNSPKLSEGDRWEQVQYHELDYYLDKIHPG